MIGLQTVILSFREDPDTIEGERSRQDPHLTFSIQSKLLLLGIPVTVQDVLDLLFMPEKIVSPCKKSSVEGARG